METFAEKLKAAKKAAGLTQQKMADQMLIPKRTIEEWERGNNAPPSYVQRFVLNELESLTSDNQNARTKSEPIIDRDLYERAQAKLLEKKENAYIPPLGYKEQDGKLVVNEEEAEVVKRAFSEMCRDGRVSPETEKELRRLWARRSTWVR